MWPGPEELPNGFHDARLLELHVDLVRAEVRLGFRFLVGVPEAETEEGREAMRPGTVTLAGVSSMRIEPPDARNTYTFSHRDGVMVDGDFGAYPGEPTPPDDGLVRLWFYVSTWNARMTFTAKSSDLVWTG